MRELLFDEYAFVFGGKTTEPTRPSSDILRQMEQAIREGSYGTAIGLMMDNPFTLIGNGLDMISSAINSVDNSAYRQELNDTFTRTQAPAE